MTTTIVSGQQPKQGQSVDISSGLGLPAYNHVDITHTTTKIDHYIFKMGIKTVAVMDLTYADDPHADLTTVNRTS
jgi:hypothetical protein